MLASDLKASDLSIKTTCSLLHEQFLQIPEPALQAIDQKHRPAKPVVFGDVPLAQHVQLSRFSTEVLKRAEDMQDASL